MASCRTNAGSVAIAPLFNEDVSERWPYHAPRPSWAVTQVIRAYGVRGRSRCCEWADVQEGRTVISFPTK
jgi:hypothetical protein